MKRIFVIILIIFPIFTQAKEIKVVSSIKPIKDIISAIAIKDINHLIANNNSIHHYSLKLSDIKAIDKSDVVFLIDYNFEYYMKKITQNINHNVKIIELSKINSLKLLNNKNTNNLDYHIWLDTNNSLEIAKYITEILSSINPKDKDYYHNNLLTFESKVREFDIRAKQKLNNIKHTAFITEHDGYLYLEQKYNLNNLGSIGLGHDLNITINQFANLKDLVKKNNIRCLFTDKNHHNSIVDKLKYQTNIKSIDLDAEWGEDQSNEDSYINLMDKLVDNMVKCFI